MANDAKRRQKKLERKNAKRKTKHHQLVKEKNAGLPERLAEAAQYPLLDVGVATDLWEHGIGQVFLSRQLPGGKVAYGVFLVDLKCLGVKNAFADIRSVSYYQQEFLRKTRSQATFETWEASAARKLVESAVAYAQRFGLAPHADYHKACKIFGDIDASLCQEEFEFGQDGKPYFVAGPYDSPDRCRAILKSLEFHTGPGGFNYLIPMQTDGSQLPEDFFDDADYLSEEEDDDEQMQESPGGLRRVTGITRDLP